MLDYRKANWPTKQPSLCPTYKTAINASVRAAQRSTLTAAKSTSIQ
jgi:hypothetical protein